MDKRIFLIDTSVFIDAYKLYYAPDLCDKFWEQLREHIENGNIAILDLVKAEITKYNDDLSKWFKELNIKEYLDKNKYLPIENYKKIVNHLQKSGLYRPSATLKWSENVADPWLIAYSMGKNYTIITNERPTNPTAGGPCKEAKIPNIAKAFEVRTDSLFNMMRALGIHL